MTYTTADLITGQLDGARELAALAHTDAEPQLVWTNLDDPDAPMLVVLPRSVRPHFRTDGVLHSTETPEQRAEAEAEHERHRRNMREWDTRLDNAVQAIYAAEDAVVAARRRHAELAAEYEVEHAAAEQARTEAGEY